MESEAATVRDSKQRRSLLRGRKPACAAQGSRGGRGGMDSGTALHLEIRSRNSAVRRLDVDKSPTDNRPGEEQRGRRWLAAC